MTNDVDGQLLGITGFIAAAGALGTAAYGLVDASKALRGGISNVGFGDIRTAITPLIGTTGPGSPRVFGKQDVLATLHANWLNGMAKADQKAVAKSLIRMGITPENAQRLADETGVDAATLRSVAQKIRDGTALQENEVSVLGRFDAIISAVLDEAYERADQRYRNYCKAAALGVSLVLSIAGAGLIYAASEPHWLLEGALVGLISTPLAPVAKDLSTALNAAVKAVAVVKH